MGSPFSFDWLVVGAGIVGLAVARELMLEFPNSRIAVLEKEGGLGCHASGRNSGVLHAGIYYSPETLKARLCVEGRRLIQEYCYDHKLSLKAVGKVILPASLGEDAEILRLLANARANGVNVELIDSKSLSQLEPSANQMIDRALFSPETAIVSPKEILECLRLELLGGGVRLFFGQEARSINIKNGELKTQTGSEFRFGYLVNAAGAYADKIAHLVKMGLDYTILPFRGSYFKLSKASGLSIKRNIYPVPDSKVPFLGVHFSPSLDGNIYIGPTAMPALGREHYTGLKGLELYRGLSMIWPLFWLYAADRQGVRRLIHSEIAKMLLEYVYRDAKKLVPEVRKEHILKCEKRGIRAQLFSKRKQEIIMDFVIEQNDRSMHILNAVSPGFTCGFSFAKLIVKERILKSANLTGESSESSIVKAI